MFAVPFSNTVKSWKIWEQRGEKVNGPALYHTAMLHQRHGTGQRIAIETKRSLFVHLPQSDGTGTSRQARPQIAWRRVFVLLAAVVAVVLFVGLVFRSWRTHVIYGFRAASPVSWPLSVHAIECAQAAKTHKQEHGEMCASPARGCLVHVLIGYDDLALWNVVAVEASEATVRYNESSHWCPTPRERSRPQHVKLQYYNVFGAGPKKKIVYGSEAACLLHHLDLLQGNWICTL
jgi:peptide deformylase